MATPSSAPRPMATSTPTPKPNHASTPSTTHLTSPAAVAMARQFSASHRSPSMKTPSHSHNISTSSHPAATPLGASSMPIGEDATNFQSPAAALIASMNGQGTGLTPATGLTPLGMGGTAEGLGISNATDLHMPGTHIDPNGTIKDPEADRDRRLADMLAMLKTRVAGRGVCREAVERLAQLAGFTFLWQDDTLTIAGNSVDLEIDFFPDGDRVRDVSLKIAISADAEAEGKEEASKVLKEDLTQEDEVIGWKDLSDFSRNLETLGRFDKLSQGGVNCFEAVEGLYESFRKIWVEERKRMRKSGPLTRLSRGGIGRPVMHKGQRLGLGLEYWANKTALTEFDKPSSDADAMDTEEDGDSQHNEKQVKIWSGRIECEAGYPSMRVSKDWISVDVLQSVEGDSLNDPLPGAWLEPPPTLTTKNDDMETSGNTTGDIFVPQPPNVRFAFELEPEILLPLAVASNAFSVTGVSLIRDRISMRDVQDHVRDLLTSSAAPDGSEFLDLRWTKELTVFGHDGKQKNASYTMSFFTGGSFWCYPVQALAFDHPRQIAGLLPVLRQYAMLWTLVENATKNPKSRNEQQNKEQPPPKQPSTNHRQPKKRNNINPQKAKLAELLKPKSLTWESPTIDVTLRFSTGHQPQPVLDLRFPLHRNLSQLAFDSPAFGCICVEVALGGDIQITKAENLPFAQGPAGREKLAKILRVCEDVTTLVAWVHERLEQENVK